MSREHMQRNVHTPAFNHRLVVSVKTEKNVTDQRVTLLAPSEDLI